MSNNEVAEGLLFLHLADLHPVNNYVEKSPISLNSPLIDTELITSLIDGIVQTIDIKLKRRRYYIYTYICMIYTIGNDSRAIFVLPRAKVAGFNNNLIRE